MQRPVRRSRSFNVTDLGTNRKPIYDFLLVINTNLPNILHRFQVMADYICQIFAGDMGGLLYFTPSLGVIPFEYRHKYTTETTLCLKKTSPMFLAITRKSIVGFS